MYVTGWDGKPKQTQLPVEREDLKHALETSTDATSEEIGEIMHEFEGWAGKEVLFHGGAKPMARCELENLRRRKKRESRDKRVREWRKTVGYQKWHLAMDKKREREEMKELQRQLSDHDYRKIAYYSCWQKARDSPDFYSLGEICEEIFELDPLLKGGITNETVGRLLSSKGFPKSMRKGRSFYWLTKEKAGDLLFKEFGIKTPF
jgi:hypothetical protein